MPFSRTAVMARRGHLSVRCAATSGGTGRPGVTSRPTLLARPVRRNFNDHAAAPAVQPESVHRTPQPRSLETGAGSSARATAVAPRKTKEADEATTAPEAEDDSNEVVFSFEKDFEEAVEVMETAAAAAAVVEEPEAVMPKEVITPTTGVFGMEESAEAKYLAARVAKVQQHFPSATPVDDFLVRVEMALCAHGFTGDNSIGVCNLCRDEATNIFKNKIEEVFPLNFNINGLGGSITCGVVGMGAGLSHSPTSPVTGKKKYIFFSFPHIAVTPDGTAGPLARPGQQECNSACGAMIGALGQLSTEGVEAYVEGPGVHEPNDPEYSILKQRLARRIVQEDKKMEDIDLVELTKIGERQISADLEYLISQAVDPETADYAIVTGIQVHNWGSSFDNEEPNIEFVAPTQVSVVINGEKTELDLSSMPAPSPRMIRRLSKDNDTVAYTGSSTVSALKSAQVTELMDVGSTMSAREASYAELLTRKA